MSTTTNVDTMDGLSTKEAEAALETAGLNKLPDQPLPGVVQIFFRQFLSPFIYILLAATIISLLISQYSNAIFIAAVLILNAIIGTVQEYSAQRSAAALRNLTKGNSKVIRDGTLQEIDSEHVVPSDILVIESGDKIPADIDLLSSIDLEVDESMLTGESIAVRKQQQSQKDTKLPLTERSGECFAGTIVTHGRGVGKVSHTGMQTELGNIANEITYKKESDAPLVIRIRKFTYQAAAAIFIAIAALITIMLIKGSYSPENIAMMAIGLAVSTIPEGLPAALTVALSIGMRRMAKVNVIIRKLVAVEALGSCTFICSDKTGTLTVNELTIQKLLLPNGNSIHVTGEGISPNGTLEGELTVDAMELGVTGILANEAQLDYSGAQWTSQGDIVDVAFLVLAKKMGLSIKHTNTERQQLDLIPYESENAFSGSLNSHQGNNELHVKGSPEKILAMCNTMLVNSEIVPLDEAAITRQFQTYAENGYRIIALAKQQVSDSQLAGRPDKLMFLGMVAMIDPIRPEARGAVAQCQRGGIDVAMVTGDHPATAKSIAMDLGLCDQGASVVTGTMIADAQTDQERQDLILPTRVFARIDPIQKKVIVETLANAGHFVAVTGDGVNDAPAIKKSHAGIAMGKRGSDVAKETAQIIITDDNFSSIVAGIEQGRIVYNNIRKVIGLLMATGLSAIILFFLSVLAGLPMPLTAIQLLWLNLVANGIQDVALAFESKEGHELESPPRSPKEPIFDRKLLEHTFVIGGCMGMMAFFTFLFLDTRYAGDVDHQRNLMLLLLIMFGNIHALSSRSEARSIFKIPLVSNLFLLAAVPLAQLIHFIAMYVPGLNHVVGISPVTLNEWGLLLLIALVFLGIEELHKCSIRLREKATL